MARPPPQSRSSLVVDDDILIPLLIRRSYHLPGNNWSEDWVQWFRNNHILLGICLHHKLHPLETWERLLLLFSSISFGLVAASLVYELSHLYPNVMAAPLTNTAQLPPAFQTRLTVGALVLWTIGGLFHGLFDMIIWHVMACACCHPGGHFYRPDRPNYCKNLGSYALIPVILALLGTAAYLVLLRATRTEDEYTSDPAQTSSDPEPADDAYSQQQQEELENIQWDHIHGFSSFSFLFKYGIELLLAWFVYFPIIGSLMFSGIFGWNGKIPILGGRPRDIELIRREQEKSHYRTL